MCGSSLQLRKHPSVISEAVDNATRPVGHPWLDTDLTLGRGQGEVAR